jgi:hypothetical protein
MGWLRAGVGVAMIAAPRLILDISDRERTTSSAVMLLRTIGIRDVALGMGVVAAARSGDHGELHRWTRTALASDSMDVVLSAVSGPAIGTAEAVAAGAMALLAVLGDLHVLRGLDVARVEPATPGSSPTR